jgi:hypothetical protein
MTAPVSQRLERPKKGAIAYVAHPPTCEFSEDLVDLAEECGIDLDIYDVEELDPPDWLPGTPTIVSRDGQTYCGDAAFEWIMKNAASTEEFASSNNYGSTRSHPPPRDEGFLKPFSAGGETGVGIEFAMAESNRMAEMAEKSCHEPLGDVQKSLDAMMNARKN